MSSDRSHLKPLAFNLDKLHLLKEIDFFALFEDSDLTKLVDEGSWLRIPAGTLIIHEGDLEQVFYILVRGRMRVFKNKKTLAFLSCGEIFGEMGALLFESRSANVLALEDCYVFKYSEMNLLRLPKNILYPVMKYIFGVTAKRLQKINRKYALL